MIRVLEVVYTLMGNIYAAAGMKEAACMLEPVRAKDAT
jgi:uncharacterized protein (DUF1800 family)